MTLPRAALLPLLALSACAATVAGAPASRPAPAAAPALAPAPSLAEAAAAPLELIESWPTGTDLDHPDLRDARDVWPEVIARSTARLDLGGFYFSNEPGMGPQSPAPGSLERTVRAVEAAAARGVKVRVLADLGFESASPENKETLARLAAQRNVEVRRIDFKALGGGVMHAKYFLADGREAVLGSQNFDWRALDHIVELGVRVRVPEVVRALQAVFDADWEVAGGAAPGKAAPAPAGGWGMPVEAAGARLRFVASPQALNPPGMEWDLPALVALIDGARRSVRAQVLVYKAGKGEFAELEEALVRAAARGCEVDLMVSHWAKRKSTVEGLKRLAAGGQVKVRFFDTPEWSGGFIPYSRTAHAKYLVVDGERAWVGTSNWEKDYFFRSRNVGVVIEGGAVPAQLERFFLGGWNGPYAEVVDPGKAYEAPRTR